MASWDDAVRKLSGDVEASAQVESGPQGSGSADKAALQSDLPKPDPYARTHPWLAAMLAAFSAAVPLGIAAPEWRTEALLLALGIFVVFGVAWRMPATWRFLSWLFSTDDE
jgi:hypothetical protein